MRLGYIKSFLHKFFGKRDTDGELMDRFMVKYLNFKMLLESNSELLKIISDIEEKLSGRSVFGVSYITSQTARVAFHVLRMLKSFENLSGRQYPALYQLIHKIISSFGEKLEYRSTSRHSEYVLPYDKITGEMVNSVGGKNANLGEIANHVHIKIPSGFAITTTAFERFIESGGLRDVILKQKAALDVIDPEQILRTSEKIQQLMMKADMPSDIETAIKEAYSELNRRGKRGNGDVKVALRSSAIGEDSDLSFAGQYLSVLNVSSDNIINEYRRILASLFTPQAISYRLHMGLTFEDASMSVACLEMIDAKASGVIYSLHPLKRSENCMIINAAWGLGPYVVDGVVTPDSYVMSRGSSPTIIKSMISSKKMRLAPAPEGRLIEEQVEVDLREKPCLGEEQAIRLAAFAMQLEEHFHCPQDIEWAINQEDEIFILQARPLRQIGYGEYERLGSMSRLEGYNVLLEGGDIVCQGVGMGPAHLVRSLTDLMSFPEGGVLVAAHSSPQYAIIMQKARAIVTDTGSITGHMASLARDFMIPAILNTKDASSLIQEGMIITVDAYSGRIYEGRVQELIDLKITNEFINKNTPIYEMLQKRANLIIPLNLVDPRSAEFTPQNCRTIHDIMRYLHERSYAEIFQISDLATGYRNFSVRLDAPVPIDLYIIDLGGGITGFMKRPNWATPDEITSIPFKSLLKGMLCEEMRKIGRRPIEVKGFLSVMSQQILFPPNPDVERFGERSYVVISDKYLNFNSRVGYHYGIIDTYCGQTSTKNYINFAFMGGAAVEIRRNRRARLIQSILGKIGFLVETNGDRVVARIVKHESGVIEEKLECLGRLLIYTQQMDMLMHSEDVVKQLTERFLKGDYNIDDCKKVDN